LKKLLCFGERVWERLRGVMEKEGWGGDVCRQAELPRCPDGRVSENEEPLPEDHHCLEIKSPEPTWWEREHWDEIYDERHLWGDLSCDALRELSKLLGKG
jgi:hypothetical protein